MNFGDLLIKLRKEQGYSQAELSRRSGIYQRYICRVERGEASPAIDKAKKMLNAMGYDLYIDKFKINQ